MSDGDPRLAWAYRRFVVVVSGPSGAGKSSFVEALLKDGPDFAYSVSATTRARRPHETEGKDYYFLSRDEFGQRVAAGRFVEWAEVHGEWYGTLRTETDDALRNGHNVLLDVDVQGGQAVRRAYPEGVFIFVLPPSMEALEARLRHRATDSEERIRLRLENAKREIPMWREYDYAVVNDDLAVASRKVLAIVWAETCRSARRVTEGARVVPGAPA